MAFDREQSPSPGRRDEPREVRKRTFTSTPTLDPHSEEASAETFAAHRSGLAPRPVAAGDARDGPPADLQSKLSSLGAGQPIAASTRRALEASMGHDLSEVRVHAGPGASALAAASRAEAFTYGRDIVFGQGHFNPGSMAGQHLLAHEAAHAAQQGAAPPLRGPRPALRARQQKQATTEVVEVGDLGNVLGRYAALQAEVSDDDWAALNAKARQRDRNIEANASLAAPPLQHQIAEVSVSMRCLFRPDVVPPSSSSVQWKLDILSEGLRQALDDGEIDAAALATTVEAEILRRWLTTQEGLLDKTVRAVLIDPEGDTAPTLPATLAFIVDETPIPTLDGSFYATELDPYVGGTMASVNAEIGTELNQVQVGLLAAANGALTLKAAKELFSKSKGDIAANALVEVEGRIKERIAAFEDVTDPSVSLWAATTLSDLEAFAETDLPTFAKEFEQWRIDNPATVPVDKNLEGAADMLMDTATDEDTNAWAVGVNAQASADLQMTRAVANVATGGATRTEAKLYDAYEAGQLSLNDYEDTASAVRTRGYIIAGVTGVLTLATGGAGGLITRAGVGFGGRLLFYGTASALTTVGTMGSANIYTSVRDLRNRQLQHWWDHSAYSAGDIAIGAGVSFGLGALLGGTLDKLMTPSNAAFARNLVALADEGATLPAIQGITTRVAGNGVVELSVPGQAGLLRVTQTGWTALAPAGEGAALTPVASGIWAEGGLGATPALSAGQLHGRPFGVAVSSQQWGVYTPGSAQTISLGLWDDAFVAGGAPIWSTAAGEGGAGLVVSGGGTPSTGVGPVFTAPGLGDSPPRFFPWLPQTLALPGPVASSPPGTAMIPWGDPGWSRVPGNAPITSPTTGETRMLWSWYEGQVADFRGAGPGETQVQIPLNTPQTFTGRSTPQSTVIPDIRLSDYSLYADAKARNWGYASNVDDLVGTIERMYVASEVEAATQPAAGSARIEIVTHRQVPVDVHNDVMTRISQWLGGRGLSNSEVLQQLERVSWVYRPPVRPP